MTDTRLLRNVIGLKGLKYKYLADELGITAYSLQKKLENDNEFKASEIKRLAEILDLSLKEKDKIFFA